MVVLCALMRWEYTFVPQRSTWFAFDQARVKCNKYSGSLFFLVATRGQNILLSPSLHGRANHENLEYFQGKKLGNDLYDLPRLYISMYTGVQTTNQGASAKEASSQSPAQRYDSRSVVKKPENIDLRFRRFKAKKR